MRYCLLVLFLLFGTVFAYPHCSAELEHALHTVYHFPEGKKIIEEVETEGAIRILSAPFRSNSHALWDPTNRTIVINKNFPDSYGDNIRSIIFELHNAKTTRQFDYLDWLVQNGRISKERYVEATERIEYTNARTVSYLLNQGISLGYFPPSCRWPIAEDFDTHFRIQKQSGHSAQIASNYDSLARYS